MCQRWMPRERQGKQELLSYVKCQFTDIIMLVVIGVMTEGEYCRVEMDESWWQRRIGLTLKTESRCISGLDRMLSGRESKYPGWFRYFMS